MAGKKGRSGMKPTSMISVRKARTQALAFSGMSEIQIAELENVSVAAIRDRLKDTLEKLSLTDYVDLSNQRLYTNVHNALHKLEEILALEVIKDGKPVDSRQLSVIKATAIDVLDRTLGFLQQQQLLKDRAVADRQEQSQVEDIRAEAEASAARIMAHLEAERAAIKDKANEVEGAEYEVLEGKDDPTDAKQDEKSRD